MRVVKHWHWFPREVVNAPPLETLNVRLDGALSNLTELKMSLLTAGGLNEMAFKGPFQPKLSIILVCHQCCLPWLSLTVFSTIPSYCTEDASIICVDPPLQE